MKNERKIIPIIVIMSIIGTIAGSVAAAGVTFGTITVTPSQPAALSTVTISVPISGEAPSEVRVTVEECNGRTGICYPDIQNVSMPLISSSIYRADVTLKHTDATYITVNIVAKISGVWQESSGKRVNFSENPDGNDGDGKKSPGFEVVVFVIAIGVILILIGRKRVK
ncbi:MAG TPA: hypothetical protein VN377_05395 [Candidatus Thermoplasmatota archaeon]|nr:hypothetical protein [Candidatus Thermoplasmatota archaeon]